MEENIRRGRAVERLSKFSRISVELGDRVPAQESTRFSRAFHHDEFSGRKTVRPVFVREPAVRADSADLRRQARGNDDRRSRIHVGERTLENASQNLRL